MQTETVRSFTEFMESVTRLKQGLLGGDKQVEGPDRFWYRGVGNHSYTLTPSLYRYHDPIEKEQLLFNLHGQSAFKFNMLDSKPISWERVIHMQHYNIPTRLLDWTATIWKAVFFALMDTPAKPCIFILNPLHLNRKSGQDGLVRVPRDSRFDFEEHFFGNPVLSSHSPLAIIPEVDGNQYERLKCQDGRFTVQGRNPDPLERQASECLARIDLHESLFTKLREQLDMKGIKGHTLFPDHEGVAQFVKSEAHLKKFDYDESIASRIRAYLQERARHDLEALKHRDRDPYNKGITFCNLDDAYLLRETEVEEMATWLKEGPPFLFITGKAGVGKTNFTLHTLLCRNDFQVKPSVFFSFKMFGSGLSPVVRDDGIGELAGYIDNIMLAPNHTEQERHVARKMIAEGEVVLALDGLDELARIRGEEAVEEMGRELDGLFGGSPKARVIITCRDHILARLKGTGALGKTKNQHELKLDPFPAITLRNALLEQLDENPPESLVEMARIPIFYEMIRRAQDHWPELIEAQDNRTKLEEVWFKVILQKNKYLNSAGSGLKSHLDLEQVLRMLGTIAGKMLHDRRDLLEIDSIPVDLTALLRELASYPFALFVQELQDTYSFTHQSLREFVLAWCVAEEIKTHHGKKPSFDLLKSSSSFDYEGHEFYDRVRDLLDINNDVINKLGQLLCFQGLDEDERNNLIRNLFEMLGELTPGDDGLVERIVEEALPYLKPVTTKAGYITYKTKYNVSRCLERIHCSAPRPYIDHITSFSWWWDPYGKPPLNEKYIYAYAIRGFHRPRQEATSIPPIVYIKTESSEPMKKLEKRVSDHLMTVIETIKEHEIPEDGIFLGINCTFALIRWLPKNPDLDRIEGLLKWLHIDWRMKQNIFYALFFRYGARIPVRFRERGLFRDAGELDENASDEAKEAFRKIKTGTTTD